LVAYRNWPLGLTATPSGAAPVVQLLPEQVTGDSDPSAAIENGETLLEPPFET
jgi:hypothetical protein